MITIRRPSDARLRAHFEALAGTPLTYPFVGATRGALPRGWVVDRHAATLGVGEEVFARARAAIRAWAPFELPWIHVRAEAALAIGVHVAVVARVLGVWWTNVSRVVEVVDEAHAFGFSYGTTRLHVESGEELFLVVRDPGSGTVSYELTAFSRPRHPLVRVAAPLGRRAQRRFARGSLAAMRAAVG